MSISLEKQAECIQPPKTLVDRQQWFASTITRSLNSQERIQEKKQCGANIAEEIRCYITPSASLLPEKRMEIYNQQYWWRLLNTLKVNFPLLCYLIKESSFNQQIAVPYLLKYPPSHWSLTQLGHQLPEWIQSDYSGSDVEILYQAALLDQAFIFSFIAENSSLVNPEEMRQLPPDQLMNQIFFTPKHLHFCKWPYRLLDFREKILSKTQSKSKKLHLKKENQPLFFILYRNQQNQIAWREIQEEEWLFLSLFKNGMSLSDACGWAEKQTSQFYQNVCMHLQKWLQEWIQLGFITIQTH